MEMGISWGVMILWSHHQLVSLSQYTVALETTTYNGFEYAAHTAFPTPWASATSTPTCGQQNIGTVTANIDITGADWYHYIWSTGDTTSTITDLDAGAYSVEISDSDGCLQKSTVLVLDTCGIVTSVSSNEFDQMESRVFPNPSTDQVFIEAKGYEEFSILDAVGHKVSSGRLTSPQMSHDVSNLPVGLYIIELSSNSRPTHILRLVISR
ncbi:MAG: T9SS type A sorting domain-containing protein [Candidatus Paceibacterota bacterium]